MKKKTIAATGITLAAVVALAGGYLWSTANNRPQIATAEAVVAPLSITVDAAGSLATAHSSGVYPPAPGTLAAVKVRDGDSVKAGAVVAVMDTSTLRLAVVEAQAARTAARAQLEAVNNGVPGAIERAAANAALSAARAQVHAASKNYSSYRHDYHHATDEEQHLMKPTLRTLKAAKAQADAALKAAQASLSRLSASSRVTLARAAAEQAAAAASTSLALAERHLAAAELTAPFAGTVHFNGTVEKGSGVTPGVAVLTVVDPARLDFEASVNESDIASVDKGQAASVTLDSFPERSLTGRVKRVESVAESTGTGSVAFNVTISFDAGGTRLFAGMSGSAAIVVEAIPDALTVPIESVLNDGTRRVVFVLTADDTVRRQQVTIGASTDSFAQVLSGVREGDRVVTTGASALTDGQRVRTS